MSERATASGTSFWGDADDTEARERYRTLVNAIDDGVYQLDAEDRFVAVNDIIVETTGYTREELLGEHVSRLFDEDAVSRIEREVNRLRTAPDERSESLELAVETAAGAQILWELRVSPIVENETVQGTIGIAREITERRRAQQRLQEERDMFAEGPAVVFRWANEDGWPIEYVSENVEDVFGYTPAELESGAVPYTDLLLEEELDRIAREVEQNSDETTERFSHDPYRIQTSDGDVRWVKDVTKIIRDDAGEITHYLGYLVDVTERKEQERELRKYEAIVETINDGIYVKDEDGRFTMVNEAYAELTGYDREELIGEHASLVVDEDVIEQSRETRESATEDTATSVEAAIQTADGDTVPAEGVSSTLQIDDEQQEVGVVRDITERKQRRRRIEESERRYRTLVENFPNGAVGLFDEELRYTAVGGQFLDEVGIPKEERVGYSIDELYPDELVADVEPYFRAALDGEKNSFEVEYQGRHLFAHTLPVNSGAVEASTGMLVIQDITERREAQQDLRESETRFRMLAENLEEVVWMATEDAGEFIYINPAFEEVWGLEREALYDEPLSFLELVHPDDRERVRKGFTALPEREFDEEFRVERPDGEIRWVRAQGTSVDDEDMTRVIGIGEDVTEHKEHERELEQTLDLLQQSNEQLSALNRLYQIARDINWQLAQQSTREEIESVVCERLAESDTYEFAWVGTVDGEEIVPSTTANTQGYLDDVRITVDGSPSGQGPTGTALRTGELQVVGSIENAPEYEPWREQAAKRGFEASASIPIAYENHQYGVLNVYAARERAFDDDNQEVLRQLGEIMGLAITAIEREQQVEYERERLEFVNRLLRHNLLNGLNAVQAQTSLLESHVESEGDRYLETIRERIDDMADLIETMRSLMTIITDENRELQAVDLEPVLRGELRQARKAHRDATFELRGDLSAVGSVSANEVLPEVFENLLTNAVQHNDADSPAVTVTVESDDDHVTVHVADNGPGIPDELNDRVFQKGEKCFDSPGTGFGLYLAREIVEGCGGTIDVADNDPTGAVFSVTLPRA